MPPSISLRDSIRWLPDPPSEPTRTVVLTSPQNRFVDIRVLRNPAESVKKEDEEYQYRDDKLPSSRLDWGFAGTSFSTAPTEAEAAEQKALIAHAKWTHWVDSRHADAEAVSDAGDMFALQDGRTLEMGSMVNPETGELGKYEEIWRDVEVVGTGGDGGKGEGGGGNSQDDAARQKGQRKKTCTVLVLDAPEHQARGMVVQLGQFCQGILRCGDEVSSERWIWAETRGWLREVSLGRFFVPCGVCCEGAEKVPEVGGKVALGEWEWWVVEKGEV